MEGQGAGRKPHQVWEHVIKLDGQRVMCRYCGFEFSAPSSTRITSHLYSIPNRGIRGCPKFAASGSNERDKSIGRSGNLKVAESMATDTNLVVNVNTAPESTNKRKVIVVEGEQVEAKVQGRVLESSVEEVRGEESVKCGIRGSLRSIEHHVAYLETTLATFVVRERKLQEELAEMKKSKEEASQFMNRKSEMEGKLNEALTQMSLLNEKLVALEWEKTNLLAKITALEAKAENRAEDIKIFSLTEKEKADLPAKAKAKTEPEGSVWSGECGGGSIGPGTCSRPPFTQCPRACGP